MKANLRVIRFGFLLLLFLLSTYCMIFQNIQNPDLKLEINGKEVSVSLNFKDDILFVTLQAHEPGVIISSLEFLKSFSTIQSINSIQVTISNSDDAIIEDQILTDPLVILDSVNVTVQNITFQDFIVNDTVNTVLKLENCPDSLINNCFIQNIVANTSSIIGIELSNSDDTSIINSTLDGIVSNSSSFLTSSDAFGVFINSSNNIIISNLTLNNVTAEKSSYGIYGINADSFVMNTSNIVNITSKSSWGIFLDSCDSPIISQMNITHLTSSTFDSSAIFANNCPSFLVSNVNINSLSGKSRISAIEVLNSNPVSITNNSINSVSGSSFLSEIGAISLDNCPNGNILANNISYVESIYTSAAGIYLNNSKESDIKNNTISMVSSSYNSGNGIKVVESNSTDIIGNIIINITTNLSNNVGSNIHSGGFGAEVSSTNDFSGYGIHLLFSSFSVIIENSINETKDWAFIDETSAKLSYLNNKIDGQILGLRTFVRPFDLTVEQGTVDPFNWTIWSVLPSNYTVYRNDIIDVNTSVWGGWGSLNFTVEISLTDLVPGEYDYCIVFNETSGQNLTDRISLTVLGNQSPIIIESPEDNFYYQYGSPNDYILSWRLSDDFPSNYTIYRNGSGISFDKWTSNTSISVSVGGFYLGVHNITLVAQDNSGNLIKDLVYVWVLETTEISVTCNTADYIQFEVDTVDHTLNWTIISVESGTYNIYQDSLKVTTGNFTPGNPIEYPINNLGIGTYIFTLEAIDPYENTIEYLVIVEVISTSATQEDDTTHTSYTAPSYTVPTYTPGNPAAEFPVTEAITLLGWGGFIGLISYLGAQRFNLIDPLKAKLRGTKKIEGTQGTESLDED